MRSSIFCLLLAVFPVMAGEMKIFARTAKAGEFTVDALRETGEHGGALTPTSEDEEDFTDESNEAFGACMTLWNRHEWNSAKSALEQFATEHPQSPWCGEAKLHIACFHKFRGEYAEAEKILAELWSDNRENPIGRKALVRLAHLYFETCRYRASCEALLQLLEEKPVECEKTFALNWLTHVQQSWLNEAKVRDCGPQAFAGAAWIQENSEASDKSSTGMKLKPFDQREVARSFSWYNENAKKAGDGIALSEMSKLLAAEGWSASSRKMTYDELVRNVTQETPAVLCLLAPQKPLFAANERIRDTVQAFAEDRDIFENSGEIGHYIVLLKCDNKVAWLYDPQSGVIQKSASALKDLWLQGKERGIAVFMSNVNVLRKAKRALPGLEVSSEEAENFIGGCCGHSVNNNDTGCGNDELPWGRDAGGDCGKGMPVHEVNTLNMNYILRDTPIWSAQPYGPELALTLTYNNRESYYAALPIEGVQQAPFGYRWSCSYEGRYALDPNDDILVRFPNGSDVYFNKQSDGTYLPRDYRYADEVALTVDAEQNVVVDFNHGDMKYIFHSLTNSLMQQTLRRIEDRFGTGVSITRDLLGRIVRVDSDWNGMGLKFWYNSNGNVYKVDEQKDGSPITRYAWFEYDIADDGVSELAAIVDMGGLRTEFKQGTQCYDIMMVDGTENHSVTSAHHVVSFTWPNGGEWKFDLRQTFYKGYTEPVKLIVTDPEANQAEYNYYAYSESHAGPVGRKDRNGASWFNAMESSGASPLGNYGIFVNDRATDEFYVRRGECASLRWYSSSGRRDLLEERIFTEASFGEVGQNRHRDSDRDDTANVPRIERKYQYTDQANGARLVTLNTSVYERQGSSITNVEAWQERYLTDKHGDVQMSVARDGTVSWFSWTNRLLRAVRVKPPDDTMRDVFLAEYNNKGQMLWRTVDGGLSNKLQFVYNDKGELAKLISPDGNTQTISYAGFQRRPLFVEDARGNKTQYVWDSLDRISRVYYPDGTETSQVYGDCCGPTTVCDRRGVTSYASYDKNKRIVKTVVPMNSQTETVTRREYMGEGELKSFAYGSAETNLAVRTFEWLVTNGATRLVSRTTPNGKTLDKWQYSFNGLPIVQRTTMAGIAECPATNKWDQGRGLFLSQDNGHWRRSYAYDDAGRMTNAALTTLSGVQWDNAWSCAYNGFSSVTQEVFKSAVVNGLQYSFDKIYDECGRLATRTLHLNGNDYTTSWQYDSASSRVVSVTDPFTIVQYSYDEYGALTNTVLRKVDGTLVSSREDSYDRYGRLKSRLVKTGVCELWREEYSWDIDRLASVSNRNGVTRYNYDLQGHLVSATTTTPSNTVSVLERFSYDAAGNMTSRSFVAEGNNEGDLKFTPNPDDELAKLAKGHTATLFGRVDTNATVTLPLNPKVTVEQDERGNWLAPFVPVSPDANGIATVQLKASVSNEPPQYKAHRFRVNQKDCNAAYTIDGSLTAVDGDLGVSYGMFRRIYQYWNASNTVGVTSDVFERRVHVGTGNSSTTYVWDGMEIIAALDFHHEIKEWYSRGVGIAGDVGTLLAATHFDGGTNYTVVLHSNWRGDVVSSSDTSGNEIGTTTYSAFGMKISESGWYRPRFGFCSKEMDAAGLVYFGFRYYSPYLCRWITIDPIRENGGFNLYCFCGNNPICLIDPYGEDAFSVFCNISDVTAGFADTISFGLTQRARDFLWGDDTTDTDSAFYQGGEIAGIVHGLAMGGRGVFKGGTKNVKRLFVDGRQWKSISREYWRDHGGANGKHLHHWAITQSYARENTKWLTLSNGRWNQVELSAGFNSWMNGKGKARLVELGLRGDIIATTFNPYANFIGFTLKKKRCNE